MNSEVEIRSEECEDFFNLAMLPVLSEYVKSYVDSHNSGNFERREDMRGFIASACLSAYGYTIDVPSRKYVKKIK